jgi:hypothetical protein
MRARAVGDGQKGESVGRKHVAAAARACSSSVRENVG